jgi:hypothetical protein
MPTYGEDNPQAKLTEEAAREVYRLRNALLAGVIARRIVPASHDERRYAVNAISEKWKKNPTYFGPLFEEVNKWRNR